MGVNQIASPAWVALQLCLGPIGVMVQRRQRQICNNVLVLHSLGGTYEFVHLPGHALHHCSVAAGLGCVLV